MTARRIFTLLLLLGVTFAKDALAQSTGFSINPAAPPSPVLVGTLYAVSNAVNGFQFSAGTPTNPNIPATWALDSESGPLPPGLTLSPSGLLAGQTTTAGTFSFIIRATAVNPQLGIATNGFTIEVDIGAPAVNRSTFNPNAAVGAPYSNQLGALGGTPPYTWLLAGTTSSNDGISISSTGLLSGTPVSSGSVGLQVQITDSAGRIGNTGNFPLTLNVAGAFAITTTTLPSGVIGTAYSQTLQATGGSGTLTWTTLSAPPLPPGLTLNASGLISGTPTANGPYAFTATVTDATQIQVTKQLSIQIGSFTISTASPLPAATVGVPYSGIALTSAGGTGTITWTQTGLPQGMTLNSASGVIAGQPTTAGTATVHVTATDANSATATKDLTLVVAPPVFIITTTSPLHSGTVGIPYTPVVLQSTGGIGTITWTQSGLPTGMTIDGATGTIAGTPPSVGTISFSATATDANSATATANFSILVNNPALTVIDVTASCFQGAAFAGRRFPDPERVIPTSCPANYQYTATGGTGAITWSVTPALPTGVTLNSSTGILSGTFPNAGTVNFTVVATDSQSQQGSLPTSITVAALPQLTSNDIILGGIVAPASIGAAQQPPVVVSIGGSVPFIVKGIITLSFTSSVGGDDQLVRFSNGTRNAGFSISPTSGGRATFNDGTLLVVTGTTAGTISLSATFSDNSTPANDMTPRPVKVFTYTIGTGAPVITKVILTSNQSCSPPTCFLIAVTGYSTPRDMSSGLFTFAPTTSTNLAATTATVQLGAPFTTWYGTTASNAFGSQFTFTVPFTFTSTGPISAAPFSAVTVSLTNSKGTSSTFGPVSP